jgi:hypothetical protein
MLGRFLGLGLIAAALISPLSAATRMQMTGAGSVTGGGPPPGTPTWVQGNVTLGGATSRTSFSTTLPGAAGAGDLVVASCGSASGAATFTFSDDKGNAYTTVDSQTTTGFWYTTGYALNVAGGPTVITCTSTAAGTFWAVVADDYSGVAPTSALDQHVMVTVNGTIGTNAITTGNVTTTAAGELIYGTTVNASGNGTIVAGTGFTQRQSSPSAYMTEDQVQSSAGAIAATFTSSALDDWIVAILTFKHQ